VNHAVAETAFIEQFELEADIFGKGRFAASHHDGRDEQVALVDQRHLDRLGDEIGTAHGDVTSRCLHLPDLFRVEVSLDPRPGAGHCLERLGVHDRVGRVPYLREVAHEGPLVGKGLPGDHDLIHAAPVEIGAYRPLEVVDEGVHLLVRLSPVEVAVLVGDVAVQRRDRRVDQLGRHEISVGVAWVHGT